MQKSIDLLLHEATTRYSNLPDLEVLRELATRARYDPPGYDRSEDDGIAEEIERKFKNLLFYAICKGEVTNGWPLLVRAAENGQLAVVELLLERGADPLKGTIGDRLPLHFAAENGHLPVVRILLQQPTVDPNKKDFSGQTALFKAASRVHHPVVELLLQQKGINPDNMSNDGFTPFLQVIFSKHENVVQLLLDRPDVNPNQHELSYHQTPLWMTSTAGDNILQMFLNREGVRINDHSRRGETTLYQAIQRGRLSAAQMLLDPNADPNIPNDEFQTPLS
ncbi:hypothetical protein ABVK25_007679 [Lepraria finkii]|uniref:Uncharacterized protein n=1 Tax=Lepraria finkii TaxID=1340010 RepID=A0ABR4B254_9LECA